MFYFSRLQGVQLDVILYQYAGGAGGGYLIVVCCGGWIMIWIDSSARVRRGVRVC